MSVLAHAATVTPMSAEAIRAALHDCPRLPSLRSINSALRELATADQKYSDRICDLVRRDPSLAERLLRLVNSVYYGLTAPVRSIEDAVFYLGVRQIRQLAMVTPVIEDFKKLTDGTHFGWREFWQHCIATAILTRELMTALQTPAEEIDYVAGLLHDVGKIVMAASFPAHFASIHDTPRVPGLKRDALETQVLGMSHAEIGALYLEHHHLPEVLVNAARFHHAPERASSDSRIIAALHVADAIAREEKLGFSGNDDETHPPGWFSTDGWKMLTADSSVEPRCVRRHLDSIVEKLPSLLAVIV